MIYKKIQTQIPYKIMITMPFVMTSGRSLQDLEDELSIESRSFCSKTQVKKGPILNLEEGIGANDTDPG